MKKFLKKKIKKINKKINKWNIEILTLKQMLQRVPIALATLKVGNISESILNEIRKVIYSLYWEKKVTKNVCNNIMNSIKL